VATPVVVPHSDVGDAVDEIFDGRYAVVIMDSDFTTFAEVEEACITLFGYTAADAAALAMRVHTTGEAIAAVLPEVEAHEAVRSLRKRNVRARAEPV
jgi:ATP-dependent Clp protease adapter protein ClpS